jgi:HK97 family phage portal protein
MAVVQNEQGLVGVQRPTLTGLVYDAITLYNGTATTYAAIYERQPELRSAVDFLARNISQVPLHIYQRIDDNERVRISEGPLAATIDRPDVHTTRSRWLDAFVKDLAIYDQAYFVKVRGTDGRLALVRIPPATVELLGTNWLRPDGYRVHGNSGTVDFDAAQIIDIHGYNPLDPRKGLSPIETLRRLLAEQHAAGEYREKFWQNSARMGGIIERPQNAPQWSDTARARFRADFESTYTGAAASGRTLVLEEGMTYKPTSFSARDAQFLESVQLSREVVAAAYGIPNGLLGLGSNTYASLTEQHRQLYSDCLAPWLVRIQEELEAQLLPEFDLVPGTYLEFNISAKLAGSFTEQAAVLQASVGAPYLTRNEARARLNLPPVEDGDALVTPLNVLVGGMANPQDSVSTERQLGLASATPEAKSAPETAQPDVKALRRGLVLRQRRIATDALQEDLVAAFERQKRSVLAKLGAKAKSGVKAEVSDVFDRQRFSRELGTDMKPVVRKAARSMASTVGEWDPDNASDYLDTVAENFADSVVEAVADDLDTALGAEDAVEETTGLFDRLAQNMAPVYAASLITGVGEFARAEAAAANDIGSKTWLVTSGNPRSSHAALDGETVARSETFSNGAAFPGDPTLPDEERSNCQCLVDWE